MISFHRARIQAIRVRINQVENDLQNHPSDSAQQNLANLRSWINTSTRIINELRARINDFETLYGFTPEGLAEFMDSMNIPGLTPTPARPVEAPPASSQIPGLDGKPSTLINFYNNILSKYEQLTESELPEGVAINEVGAETYRDEVIQQYIDQLDNLESSDEEVQLVLILIIAAMRLGNATAVEFWRSKLEGLVEDADGDDSSANSAIPPMTFFEENEAIVNIFASVPQTKSKFTKEP